MNSNVFKFKSNTVEFTRPMNIYQEIEAEIMRASNIIITAHKSNVSVVSIMRDQMAMAARSDDVAKSKQLQKWLENEGLWD